MSVFQKTYHEKYLTPDKKRETVWVEIVNYLSRYLPKDAEVLELGAGYCYWINHISAKRKVAIDMWEFFPNFAAGDVTCIVHDLTKGLDVAKGQFDIILASNLLEHFDDLNGAALLNEIYKKLKLNGLIVLIQPNFRFAYRRYFDDYTHKKIFTDMSLQGFLEANGFKTVYVEPKFTPLSVKSTRLPNWRWLIRLYLHSPFKPFAGQMLIVAQKLEPDIS
jgi:SAM-dependent methyltransferase